MRGYVPGPGGWATGACEEQRETFVAPVPVRQMFGLALAPLPALVAGWIWRDRWWVVALAAVVVLGAVPLLVWWVE
ncbi:hypothetical protein [Nocardiopsis sp. FIRDI 009]|uniref:hypothetical protein n=1 Tax=Nocardiopsis sp. FIRDI 009 TaxID=714197 RepID=UPI000E23A931|nr:hypothetical protein [Nocardiopsis sp. FIRDI 009]